MFSYVFMKILEGRPRSYDRRINRASRGRIPAVKRKIAVEIGLDERVLEIGCGTGELASILARQGAVVEAFDHNASMVENALERIHTLGYGDRLTIKPMGVEGMDGLPACSYQWVVSTLVFSELSDDQRRFALKHAWRILTNGGRIVIADEAVPRKWVQKLLHSLVRIPLLLVTYLASGQSTSPLSDLSGEMSAAGFHIEKENRSHGDAFTIMVGQKIGHAGGAP